MAPISNEPTSSTPGVIMPSERYADGAQDGSDASASEHAHVDETVPQQGATEPGSGTIIIETKQVPFKDQVIGYAKTIRGTILRKPETKATGDKILNGEMSAKEYFDQKKGRKSMDQE